MPRLQPNEKSWGHRTTPCRTMDRIEFERFLSAARLFALVFPGVGTITMKTIWFVIPFALMVALTALALLEAKMSPAVWWTCVLPALLALALWKYRVRVWIGQHLNSNMSEDEFKSAVPMAYGWLGMYFVLIGGFLVAIISSQIYGYWIPSAAFLAFLSLWWTKTELWGLMLCRDCRASEVQLKS